MNMQTAFAEAARVVRFGDSDGKVDTPITAEMLLRARRYEDKKPDLWHTLNVVQEHVIKGGDSARGAWKTDERTGRRIRPRVTTTKQVNGIDGDAKINRALWQLAEKMAELKQAA